MAIDRLSMRAPRVCSSCSTGLLLLGALASCRESGRGAAPATAAAGAAETAAQGGSHASERLELSPGAAGSSATAGASATGGASSTGAQLSAQAPELLVSACSPCKFSAGQGVEYEIQFEAPASDRELRQIQVWRVGANAPAGAAPATLTIEDGFTPTGNFMLQALDLNFDGILDLGFGPVAGTPNLTLSYWVHDPSGWRSLGMLSNVKVMPAAREVVTREKGGHAGMLWQESTFRWQGDELVLTRSVQQEEVPGRRDYRKVTRTYESGKQTSEKTESVPAPASGE